MNKVYIDPEIYYVQNVLSPEDLAIVKAFVEEENGWIDGKDSYLDTSNSKPKGQEIALGSSSNRMKFITNDIYEIFEKAHNDFFAAAEPELNLTTISRYIQSFAEGYGDHGSDKWAMHPHQDNDPDFYVTANIQKGLVFYINDDFQGGEIEYVNKGIIHKPVANSMIVHCSNNLDYTHGVRMITKGIRYAMTNFYRS
jgi:hypothetical protein